ncbi:MAG TPA: tRNA (adenosine(37)-N6)-threonylcarbamoyltransferase complex dimerization subunit type 1 TsaB [Candidatus Nitrosotenuis sp.]|jgi:tRNA threonylcarbamoyladenosine biosynthesis protein TsaB|nr:tRNA (adenosine(37)-N6)-threonylcarbamoyltransferase complex dimerization subunit type 1 TsaB [Candidatus Nitrosotenuis sp.]
MILAALDCSGESFSTALLRDGECLAEVTGLRPRAHLQLLMPSLQQAAFIAGVDLARVEAVAVTVGPGSFTGLRLGVVTARTLAQVLGCPAVGVNTLEALALNCPQGDLVVPALDARRGEIFAAAFAVEGGQVRRLTPDAAFTPAGLAGFLAQRGGGLVLGNALARYGEVLSGACLLPSAYWWVRAAMVGRLGAQALARGEGMDPLRLVPSYLRPAEVQVHKAPARPDGES